MPADCPPSPQSTVASRADESVALSTASVMHDALFALAVAISGQIQNEGTLCHGKCLNPRYETTGDCPSGFCGSGACCQRGSVKPPCNGISMGCEGFK